MYQRPTTMAEAFIVAAVKQGVVSTKVDHRPASTTWVARHVVGNCGEGKFGIVTEYDRRPQPTFKG
jgi:hypothetical protein